MTDKELMQETENSIEAATKALEQAAISAKELKEIMESRVPSGCLKVQAHLNQPLKTY